MYDELKKCSVTQVHLKVAQANNKHINSINQRNYQQAFKQAQTSANKHNQAHTTQHTIYPNTN